MAEEKTNRFIIISGDAALLAIVFIGCFLAWLWREMDKDIQYCMDSIEKQKPKYVQEEVHNG